jgi:predicted O-methyltransferase YrrM
VNEALSQAPRGQPDPQGASPEPAAGYGIDRTLARARELADEFQRRVGPVDKLSRGIAVSEAFFVFSTAADARPRQIVESGRALGQSTELLARCFPEVPVISVEADANHPDAAQALERLRGLPNVACLFGDARALLPELVLPGDVVVIDGPKRFRALKLAYKVLRRRQPSLIFMHDCPRGAPVRRYLEAHVPGAFFSDEHRFVQEFCRLDQDKDQAVLRHWANPAHRPEDQSYSATFACIPWRPRFPRAGASVHVTLTRLVDNLAYSVNKRLGRAQRERRRPEPPSVPTSERQPRAAAVSKPAVRNQRHA